MEDFHHNKKRPEIIRLKALDKFWDVIVEFYKLYEVGNTIVTFVRLHTAY